MKELIDDIKDMRKALLEIEEMARNSTVFPEMLDEYYKIRGIAGGAWQWSVIALGHDDDIQAALTQQQEAELVGEIDSDDDGHFVELYPDRSFKLGQKVYLHPPAAQPVQQGEIPEGFKICPISGRPFWGNIEHPELGLVATYGGPFDTYTIPAIGGYGDDGELRCERFDQDEGQWIEGGEPFGWFYDEQQADTAPAAQQQEAEPTDCSDAYTAVRRDAVEWLKEKFPDLCVKSGLCERIAGRLYTKTTLANVSPPKPAAQPLPMPEADADGYVHTGNAEADAIINRLNSDDPTFEALDDAVAFIYKLVSEHKGPEGFATWKDAAIAERLKNAAQPRVPEGALRIDLTLNDKSISKILWVSEINASNLSLVGWYADKAWEEISAAKEVQP